MAKKTYTIGEDSRRLLDTLDTYQAFCSELLDTLVQIYGEEHAHELYQGHTKDLEAVERIIMDYLRIQFTTQGMGTGKTDITI